MKRLIMGFLGGLLTLGLVGISTTAWATIIGLTGVNDPNNKAEVDFLYNAGTGTIDISIQNTSPLYDPRLTAFAFNVPDDVTGVTAFTGPSGWGFMFSKNSINTPAQFGFFDIAAVTGPNFNGGNPNDGIPISTTFAFRFDLAGSNLDLLTADSFLNELSYDPPGNPNESSQPFLGRFQRTGADGEGSDVAAVPEPATMLLLGSGLIGLAAAGRKKLFK